MGNSLAPTLHLDSSSKWEHMNGKRLIAAVAMNSKEATDGAIEYARKECVKPHGLNASRMEYDDMIKTMVEYLTRKYPCGDDKIHMAPLEYATLLDSSVAHECISSALELFKTSKQNIEAASADSDTAKRTLQKRQVDREYEKKGLEPPPEMAPRPKVEIGEVTKERAADAKARLIAFRATKNDKK
jgi:hypothetical protein